MIKTLFFTLALLTAQAQVDTGPSNLRSYTNIADMVANASPLSSARAVQVLGYRVPGDGGGGMFTPAASVTTTNRGLAFKSLLTPAAGFNRSLQAGEGTYDVRLFGATAAAGDDDTLAIQDALNVAASSNKVVLVPPGNYRVGGLLVTAPLLGQGDLSVIEPTGSLNIGTHLISIEKLRINILSSQAIVTTNAMTLFTITIRDVLFTLDASNPTNSPLAVNSSSTEGLRIQDCRAYRCRFHLARADDLIFQGNYTWPVTVGVVDAGSMSGNVFRGNVVYGDGLTGFDLAGQKNFLITGNVFTNTLRAIQLRGGTSTTDTDIGLIHDNFSGGEGGTFLDTGTIGAGPLTRIIRYNNFANGVLKPSGGNMNLGGHVTSQGLTLSDLAGSGQMVVTVNNAGVLQTNAALNLQMVIQDEGTSRINRGILDFVGTGVFAEDNGSNKTVVHIDDPRILWNGNPMPVRADINFSGAGVIITDNGGSDRIEIAISDTGGSTTGGGGGVPLTVRELDGTPNVTDITTIMVSNGTLTSNGVGVVTITTGGTSGGGGGTFNTTVPRIPYLSAANVFSDSPFQRDSATAVSMVAAGTFSATGVQVSGATANRIAILDASKNVTHGAVTEAQLLTEAEAIASINGGAPNGVGAHVHWSQLTSVPADAVGYAFIQDEGVARTQQATMDFVGAGVTVTDGSGKTTITIPAAPGGGDNISVNTVAATDPNFADTSEIDFILTGGNSITATLINNSIVAARSKFTATQVLLGKNSGGAGAGEEVSYAQFMEWVGSAARGDILYRNASSFTRLPAGTAGQILQTGGTDADPSWVTRTNYIVLALTDPSALVTVKTNYLSLPVGITLKAVAGRLFIAGSSGTTTIDLRKNGTSPANSVLTAAITMGSTATVQAGAISGTQTLAANDSLVGVVTTVGPAAQGAQLMISYTIP